MDIVRVRMWKAKAYAVSTEFMNRLIEKHGSVVCRELLGYDLTKKEDMVYVKEDKRIEEQKKYDVQIYYTFITTIRVKLSFSWRN